MLHRAAIVVIATGAACAVGAAALLFLWTISPRAPRAEQIACAGFRPDAAFPSPLAAICLRDAGVFARAFARALPKDARMTLETWLRTVVRDHWGEEVAIPADLLALLSGKETIIVVARTENGHLHWVLGATGGDDDQFLHIRDSAHARRGMPRAIRWISPTGWKVAALESGESEELFSLSSGTTHMLSTSGAALARLSATGATIGTALPWPPIPEKSRLIGRAMIAADFWERFAQWTFPALARKERDATIVEAGGFLWSFARHDAHILLSLSQK